MRAKMCRVLYRMRFECRMVEMRTWTGEIRGMSENAPYAPEKYVLTVGEDILVGNQDLSATTQS